MTERWRSFVAAPIDAALRDALADARTAWVARTDLDGLRWSDPARWHVTLAFPGEVEPSAVPALEAAIREVGARHRPMTVPTGGLGAFPTAGRARVAWYGIDDTDGHLADLAVDLGRTLGLDVSAPFRPHLTLARARRRPVDLRPWLTDATGSEPQGTLAVERVELLRSHLGTAAPRYETLASVPLEATRA